MNIARNMTLATLLALTAAPALAFNLNDAVNAVSGGSGIGSQTDASPEAAGLLDTLGTELKVTPEQAIGGTGALLGLAKNRLGGADYAQLTDAVPGLDKLSGLSALGGLAGGAADVPGLAGTLGNVQSMGDVNKAFQALGMDSSMVGQFVPLILQYLGQQGAGGSALQSLGSLWGAGG